MQALALFQSGAPVFRLLITQSIGDDVRQVAMLDASGRVSVHTGRRCMAEAGHEVGEQFSVQVNMMANASVWPEMALAYRQAGGNLTARLLAALQAGQAAGGDIRGQQSAAIFVVRGQSTGRVWADRVIELRVEDHTDPIGELGRLIRLHQAYELMNQGDEHLAEDRIEDAMHAYRKAAEMAPEVEEMPFWHAVTLADLGRVDEALPIFRQVFKANPNWAELVQRLPPVEMLRDDAEMMARILAERAK